MTTIILILAIIIAISTILKIILYIVRKRRNEEEDKILRQLCIDRCTSDHPFPPNEKESLYYAAKLHQSIQSSPHKKTLIYVMKEFKGCDVEDCVKIASYIDTGIIPSEPPQSLKKFQQPEFLFVRRSK